MLKSVVLGDLAPYHMFRFYHEFGITDTTSWSDFSYDRAEIILRTMKKVNMQGQVDPLAQIKILHQSQMVLQNQL